MRSHKKKTDSRKIYLTKFTCKKLKNRLKILEIKILIFCFQFYRYCILEFPKNTEINSHYRLFKSQYLYLSLFYLSSLLADA